MDINNLTVEELEQKIKKNEEILFQLVGNLYPRILEAENEKLRQRIFDLRNNILDFQI